MEHFDRRPVALVGLMGAGKSAVARALGERLGVMVVDLDELIEAEEGLTIAELFAREGEAWFRRREAELLDQALRTGIGVLACGGGVVLDARNRTVLRERCRVVWLRVSPQEAARRIAAGPGGRPLLERGEPQARLAELLAEREPHYRELAEAVLETDGRSVAEVAEEVAARLGLSRGVPR
jgi:shikimate kinase